MKTTVLFNMIMPSRMLKDVDVWVSKHNEVSYRKISKAEFIRQCIADKLNRIKQDGITPDKIWLIEWRSKLHTAFYGGGGFVAPTL